MSDITFKEKNQFEKLFGMSSGYVLDFSDRTFQDFIGETTGIDIFDTKYNYQSGSKANRLRAFWKIESNYIVGLLLENLLEHWLSQIQTGHFRHDPSDHYLYDECIKTVRRLKVDSSVENLDALKANSDDRDFNLLAKTIRESIEKSEPETALDRLHTFVVKYIRELCDRHSISYTKDTPLHSLFGGYVKHLITSKAIESEMTERILKSSISILEAFNQVRNEKSFAHDNPILNYHESILIFNDVANVISFIDSVEKEKKVKVEKDKNFDDLPF